MPDKGTIRFFDEIASKWEGLRSAMFSEGLRRRIADAVGAKPGLRIVDLGSGTGFLTSELLRRGSKVLALDASAGMLQELHRLFSGSRDLETGLVTSDSLPVPDASIDAVVANMYLHHVEDPAAAIREAVRILRPGGRFAMADLKTHSNTSLQQDHHDRWLGFEPEVATAWLAESGLASPGVSSISETCRSESCAGERISLPILLMEGRKPELPTRSGSARPQKV